MTEPRKCPFVLIVITLMCVALIMYVSTQYILCVIFPKGWLTVYVYAHYGRIYAAINLAHFTI